MTDLTGPSQLVLARHEKERVLAWHAYRDRLRQMDDATIDILYDKGIKQHWSALAEERDIRHNSWLIDPRAYWSTGQQIRWSDPQVPWEWRV